MVTPVDKPHSTAIFVALDRVRLVQMTSLLTNPGLLEVKLRSTRLTLFLTVFQMMRMWKVYLRSWLQPKSIHFLEVVRESSGEGGGSHHKSCLSSSLVLQRRCTLTIELFQLLGLLVHFPSG